MLTVVWQTKPTVSFPLEGKHVVNEHHAIRKSHDATQKSSRVRGACILLLHVGAVTKVKEETRTEWGDLNN